MQRYLNNIVLVFFLFMHAYQWYFWLTYEFNESLFDLILFYLYFIYLIGITICTSYIVQSHYSSSYYLTSFLFVIITQILLIMLSFVLSIYHQFIGKRWKEQLFMIYLMPLYYIVSSIVETVVKK